MGWGGVVVVVVVVVCVCVPTGTPPGYHRDPPWVPQGPPLGTKGVMWCRGGVPGDPHGCHTWLPLSPKPQCHKTSTQHPTSLTQQPPTPNTRHPNLSG